MNKYFVPYSHNTPVTFQIKGHRLVLLGTSEEEMRMELDDLGGDEIREFDADDDGAELFMADIAIKNNSAVVLAPPGSNLLSLMTRLKEELPWIQ